MVRRKSEGNGQSVLHTSPPASIYIYTRFLSGLVHHFSPEDGDNSLLQNRWLLPTSPHGALTQKNIYGKEQVSFLWSCGFMNNAVIGMTYTATLLSFLRYCILRLHILTTFYDFKLTVYK
jgi:hypothetical protein